MSKKNQKKRFPWGFILLLLAFCGFLTYAWGVWYVPSLPAAELPRFLEAPEQPISAKTEKETSGKAEGKNEEMPKKQTEKTQPETDGYPRRTGVYNILIAGKDDAARNTDVLMLASYDTENQTAVIAQIPRDTFCDGRKLNAHFAGAYAAAKKQDSKNPTADGMKVLCGTLEETLAVRIDHWVLVDTAAFREIVDAIGGVDAEIPYDMDYDDPAQSLSIHLKAGFQHLDGDHAEQLVRFRHDYIRGDIGRVDMQKLFLTACFVKMKEGIPILSLPLVVSSVLKHVKTDLSFSDLLFFAKKARGLNMEKLTMLTLPGTDARAFGDSGAWYYILSKPACAALVDQYLNVYECSVADRFDREGRLTDPAKPALDALYRKDIKAAVHTADEIAEAGIEVAAYKK